MDELSFAELPIVFDSHTDRQGNLIPETDDLVKKMIEEMKKHQKDHSSDWTW